jgi:UDP-N-acetylmuramyl pentapeptide synthase
MHFDGHEALARDLTARVRRGDRVFFKGSRGNKLETVVQLLERHLTSSNMQRSI